MNIQALTLVDSNELRSAAFAALLAPMANALGVVLHLVRDVDELAALPDHTALACLYSIGGLSLSDESVLQTIASLRSYHENSPIIVFSDSADSLEIAVAIESGLRGFLPTTMSSQVALAAIQFILSGGTYYPHSRQSGRPADQTTKTFAPVMHLSDHRVLAVNAHGGHPNASAGLRCAVSNAENVNALHDGSAPETRPDSLTKRRHVEVLKHLGTGATNKEIARHLNLTEATIKVYVRELMKHFGARNRIQVALKASALNETKIEAQPVIHELRKPSSIWAFSGGSRQ